LECPESNADGPSDGYGTVPWIGPDWLMRPQQELQHDRGVSHVDKDRVTGIDLANIRKQEAVSNFQAVGKVETFAFLPRPTSCSRSSLSNFGLWSGYLVVTWASTGTRKQFRWMDDCQTLNPKP
jgi:hypothetical protein